MKRLLYSLIASIAVILSTTAQTPEAIREMIRNNPNFAIPCATTYDNVEIGKIAPAPKGYKPFYFSMVSRHGSRYETRDTSFVQVITLYDRAAELGILTEKGKEVHKILKNAHAEQLGKDGELSSLGQSQLRGIGRRAYSNFGPVFDSGSIEGKASTKMRCVFSMVAFVDGLKEKNSTIPVDIEARESYLPILRPLTAVSKEAGPYYKLYRKNRSYGEWLSLRKEWSNKQNVDHSIAKLVTNPALLTEKCGAPSLFSFAFNTYYLLFFIENFEAGNNALLRDIFSLDELYSFYCYYTYSWTQWTGGFGNPFSEAMASFVRPLVEDVITNIDSAIAGKNPNSANIRFTHDSYVEPFIGELGYNNCRLQYSEDLERTVTSVPFSTMIPMAANVQIVLYRNKQGEVLVRSLLNENDILLPIECDTAPFYPWAKMRELAYSNLDKLEQSRKAIAAKYGIK